MHLTASRCGWRVWYASTAGLNWREHECVVSRVGATTAAGSTPTVVSSASMQALSQPSSSVPGRGGWRRGHSMRGGAAMMVCSATWVALCSSMAGVALQDPLLLQSILGREALSRIPLQTTLQEVDVLCFRGSKCHLHILGPRPSGLATRVRHQAWIPIGVKKHFDSCCAFKYPLRRHTTNLHDTRQLFNLILARVKWVASVQLRENTSEGPHIDRHIIRNAKDHFRRAVEAALDVCIYTLVFKTG
mmetsp:Transcript_15893/g.40454  ORF Transcript_15893/g.40454 Transcript_15893/m.40454 type:complete len:246 (+) Transcript_15893:226-963(+)